MNHQETVDALTGAHTRITALQKEVAEVAELNTRRFDQLMGLVTAQERHTHDIEVSPFKPIARTLA